MPDEFNSPNIYIPNNMSQALRFIDGNPKTSLFAGGTLILKKQNSKFTVLPKIIMYIKDLNELNKITRTERYLEIGACINLEEILQKGKHVIPKTLYKGINMIGDASIKRMATLGGNICYPEARLDLFTIFYIMDAQLEVKTLKESYWLNFNRLVKASGELNIKEGSIVSRFRIPLKNWENQFYEKIISKTNNIFNNINIFGLADTEKDVITDFKMGFGNLGKHILRFREVEAEIIGRKLPISTKKEEIIIDLIKQEIINQNLELNSYQIFTIKRLALKFIKSIRSK